MKFYNRESELSLLSTIEKRTDSSAQLTLMLGRRRVGKTRLLHKYIENRRAVYLFVAKKNEALLCAEFIETIKNELKIPIIGELTTFKQIFELLLYSSEYENFTVVIDEFQDFGKINPSIYSDMQNIWNKYKHKSKLNLIVCGSIYSLMKKIFENSKEPLFGRVNERILLEPFNINVIKQMLVESNLKFTNKDLLFFYAITGGMAKYTEILIERKAVKTTLIINEIFRKNSLLIDEGRNLLIEEMGRDYATYFSILSLIASSKTSRQAIESILQKDIGGYLDKLENEYSIIKKVRPILSKPQSRTVKYYINDNFLNFWFRFIFKYSSAVEIQNYEYLKKIVKRDFDLYSGRVLEKYFKEKLILESNYSEIGSYWERGNKNEIDIVAINKREKKVLIAEVKLNADKISLDVLILKSQKLIQKLIGYRVEYRGLSIDDM